MNLVDSSGWIEYFFEGSQAAQFAKAIEQTDNLIVPTIAIYEVFKYLFRESEEKKAWKAVGAMQAGRIIPLDTDISLLAVQFSLQCRLPMADSIILATARSYSATLWTQDADFKGMEGVRYFAPHK